MRLKPVQTACIRDIVHEPACCPAEVRVFGSRLDDSARGGDVDIFVYVPYTVDEPALLTARIAGRLSRALDDRKVDVVLAAPNLKVLPAWPPMASASAALPTTSTVPNAWG